MTQPVQSDASTFDDVVIPSSTHVPLTRTRSNLLLLLVALIWGSAFVAQAVASRSLGAFMFTGLRFALGAAVVAPFAWREWRTLRARDRQPRPRDLAHIAGLGTLLFLGSAMQQVGLRTTSVTNAGFLTALYIPLVPLLAWLVQRHLPHWTTWAAAVGCVAGSWLLATGGSAAGLAAFKAGDWWVIASSLPWAAHVLLVGRAANRLHGAMLVACGQFIVCSAWALVLISDPSWENHRALFTNAGFTVEHYPYYDAATRGVAFDALLAKLAASPAGTIVVLHACCHNPTGVDLSAAQWEQVIAAIKRYDLVPFVDMAYQGFGFGIAEDGAVVRQFLAAGLDFFVSTSFSKSFSLYGERVGALSVVCASKDEATRVLSQLKIVIRTNYSNPPTHGAQIVATVLTTPALRTQWEGELTGMRERIRRMRGALVDQLTNAGVKGDLSYIVKQNGMFSYSGLSVTQMQRLRTEFGVYGVDSGRICVAALNDGNLAYVAKAIAAVSV